MTHTLHRLGSEELLKGDYVVLAIAARGINVEGSEKKFRRILEIFARHNPVNMGNMTAKEPLCMAKGTPHDRIVSEVSDRALIHGVYTNRNDVKAVLEEIKEADLGISVVVSGIFREVYQICKEISIDGPFTVNMSLGVWGKTDLLPEEEVLEVTTMCGHGLVSHHLFKDQISKVRRGMRSVEEAAGELARQCVCGVFNPDRAAKLIRKHLMSSEGGDL